MSEPAHALALPDALFAAIVSTTQEALFRFVCRLVNDSEQAHDIVQDVFVEAVRATQRQAAPFVAVLAPDDLGVRRWLFQVASHRAISFVRHRRVLAWESLELLDPLEANDYCEPVPFEDQIAEGAVLRMALARLTPEDTALVLLKEVEGFTIAESVKILALDISLEAAKKRFQRAAERLRTAYFAQDTERGERTHR
ncbi:MAG TPA: sigma-70 family RNA polymerase sigma factor [Ktedonobacterales bacterium]|nr:sigma-70 family RNA polymerase sigma factor [Ktedonobacterales bacterium]